MTFEIATGFYEIKQSQRELLRAVGTTLDRQNATRMEICMIGAGSTPGLRELALNPHAHAIRAQPT